MIIWSNRSQYENYGRIILVFYIKKYDDALLPYLADVVWTNQLYPSIQQFQMNIQYRHSFDKKIYISYCTLYYLNHVLLMEYKPN